VTWAGDLLGGPIPEPPRDAATLMAGLRGERDPFAFAVRGGLLADRLGYAFLAGLQAALGALLGGMPGEIVAMCATEEGGAHPRAIRTRLAENRLSGHKRWASAGPLAARLLVLASRGVDASGRNQLCLISLEATRPRIAVTPMPPTRFVPEIPHAEVSFEDVAVEDADVLPGDGWEHWVKPFRTVEDIHVQAAALAYLGREARLGGWPRELVEEILALLHALAGLAAASPRAPETHLALAGALALGGRLVERTGPEWARSAPEARARWERDAPLLTVAQNARTLRREAAWQTVAGRGGAAPP
jgi:acyl-CoA dehydrogenase